MEAQTLEQCKLVSRIRQKPLNPQLLLKSILKNVKISIPDAIRCETKMSVGLRNIFKKKKYKASKCLAPTAQQAQNKSMVKLKTLIGLMDGNILLHNF